MEVLAVRFGNFLSQHYIDCADEVLAAVIAELESDRADIDALIKALKARQK